MKSLYHRRHENLKTPSDYQSACKAVEFGRLVTTGNDELRLDQDKYHSKYL